MKRVLLVEFKFHQEIIPTQLKFLIDRNEEVHLFLDQKLWDEGLLGMFREKVNLRLFKNTKSWYNKVWLIFYIKFYVIRYKISHLVLNTLDSNFINLVLHLNASLHSIGVIHRVNRIKEKKWKFSSFVRLKGALTLSAETLINFKENYPDKNASCFYPIFFPVGQYDQVKSPEICVVIPGQFDTKKKDYKALISAAREMKAKQIAVKFILLGDASKKDGRKVIEEIEQNQLQDFFVYEHGFIAYAEFFCWVSKADYILPLFSSRVDNYDSYLKGQISASFNWALTFKKPLIIPLDFQNVNYVSQNSIFYKDDQLVSVLTALKKPEQFVGRESYLNYSNQQELYLKVF